MQRSISANVEQLKFATMTKDVVMFIVRTSIVGVLGSIALILMCRFWTFFITKGLAFLFGYISYALYVHWESKGLLPNMDEDI